MTYSQFNEDELTLALVERYNPPHTFLEIGCGDGSENCTRCLLELGWKGNWIDADEANIDKAQKINPQSFRLKVTAENVGLRPPDVGVLSIDIDGNDYWVWKALLERGQRPHIVIIECQLWNEPDYIMPYNPEHVFSHQVGDHTAGAGPEAMKNLAATFGYEYVGKDPNPSSPNLFFVRNDVIAQ